MPSSILEAARTPTNTRPQSTTTDAMLANRVAMSRSRHQSRPRSSVRCRYDGIKFITIPGEYRVSPCYVSLIWSDGVSDLRARTGHSMVGRHRAVGPEPHPPTERPVYVRSYVAAGAAYQNNPQHNSAGARG